MALDKNNGTIKKYFSNTKSNVLEITEDKLRNILSMHFDKIKRSKDWISALALFLSLLVTVITATFKNFIFSPDTWKAIFVILLIGSFIYLIYTASNAAKNKDSIENIIKDLEEQV
ncbi:MAG: hypothetical protein MJY76_01580 [Bacteroidales bacterium]|nr:hypothetical protein [Bacteroidales bacterium]